MTQRSTSLGAPVQRAALPVAATGQAPRPASARPALGAPLSSRPVDATRLDAPSGIPFAPQSGAPRSATGPAVGAATAPGHPPLPPPAVQRSTATSVVPELPLPAPAFTRSAGMPTHRPGPLAQSTTTAPLGSVPRTVRATTTPGHGHPPLPRPVSLSGRPPVALSSPDPSSTTSHGGPSAVQRSAVKAPVPLRRTTPGTAAGQPVARPYPTPAPAPDLAPAAGPSPATPAVPGAPVLPHHPTTSAPPAVQRRPLPAPASAATASVRPVAAPAPPPPGPVPVPMPAARSLPAPPAPHTAVVQRTVTPPPTPPKSSRAATDPPADPPHRTDRGTADPGPAQAHPGFDPRALTDFQLDELTHRLTGRITRLLRTELRLDRERIGRLRDPRH
ncbi:hypothetical protein [Streptomyces sp. NPDC005486]|uniref:hypothetical protein n=1 Tax=Streptomyces sp. NPDC005486 TaxID=3155345 RepID=UPI0033A8FA8C